MLLESFGDLDNEKYDLQKDMTKKFDESNKIRTEFME